MVIDNKKDERLTNFRLLVSWKAYKDLNLEDRLWGVLESNACEIIKYALQNEIKVYLDGGWGVDALLKRESRIHNDIDLFVERNIIMIIFM